MAWGMPLATFTVVHVVLSLVGIGAGFVLHALAPRQTEPPFLLAQLVVLALFVVLTVLAATRFRRESILHV